MVKPLAFRTARIRYGMVFLAIALSACGSEETHQETDEQQIQALWARVNDAAARNDVGAWQSSACDAMPAITAEDLRIFAQPSELREIKIDGVHAVGGVPYDERGSPQSSGPYQGKRLDWTSFLKERGRWTLCTEAQNPFLVD
ncbi:hypothetical protein [Nocardia lasii]|uniref:Nuclear transport factor 2 family protein n=1 Tax=Nocardia lasii TaxID=1616107 RepID=A0ABW1JLI1_9NOCA